MNRDAAGAPDSRIYCGCREAASNWRIQMRRRQAPAGALPTELMVLVVIDLTGFVTAVSERAAKTRLRSVVPPLQIGSPIRFDHEGNEVLFPLHTQN